MKYEIVKSYNSDDFCFDSGVTQSLPKVTLNLGSESIEIDYKKLIGSVFKGGNMELLSDFYDMFGLGQYSKAPCGGFPNFYEIIGNKGGAYVVYSGIKEYYNSVYFVTIHNIIKAS